LNIAGSYPLDETVSSAVKSLIFRGGLLSCILVAGIAFYFLMIMRQFAKKNNRLETMINKLIKKDFSSTEEISDDVQLRELQKEINSLSSWINQLKDSLRSEEEQHKSHVSIIQKKDAELETLRVTIRGLQETISGLEEKISSASEELAVIKNTIISYNDKITKQNDVINNADLTISESISLIQNLSIKMNESTAFSAELEKEIIDGEDQVLEVSDMIKGISVDLEKIHEITRTINKIAEQTNILSMNAAIESAHAGEAGAGFGVVADEIRKLAESTRENADQISREVNALMEKIKAALKTSGDSSLSFNSITEKIRGFSSEIILINSMASQSLEKTERIREEISKTSGIFRFDQDHIQLENKTSLEKTIKANEYVKKADDVEMKTIGINNPSSRIAAEARDITVPEKMEQSKSSIKKIYTLKSSSESEKQELYKMRETIETIEIPATLNNSVENKDTEYDERGVAVKRPPTTIY
jgi:methyl-accepting chemotaxis protein